MQNLGALLAFASQFENTINDFWAKLVGVVQGPRRSGRDDQSAVSAVFGLAEQPQSHRTVAETESSRGLPDAPAVIFYEFHRLHSDPRQVWVLRIGHIHNCTIRWLQGIEPRQELDKSDIKVI